MTTFEEQLEGLYEYFLDNYTTFNMFKEDILKICLDKQKVRDAIDKLTKKWKNDDIAFEFYIEVEEMKKELGV